MNTEIKTNSLKKTRTNLLLKQFNKSSDCFHILNRNQGKNGIILKGIALGDPEQCLIWRCQAITTQLYFDVSQDGVVTCFLQCSQEETSTSMSANWSRISQHQSSRFQTNEIYFNARIIESFLLESKSKISFSARRKTKCAGGQAVLVVFLMKNRDSESIKLFCL